MLILAILAFSQAGYCKNTKFKILVKVYLLYTYFALNIIKFYQKFLLNY